MAEQDTSIDPSKRANTQLDKALSDTLEATEDFVVLDERLQNAMHQPESVYVPPPEPEHVTVPEETPQNPDELTVDEARNEAPIRNESLERKQARLLLLTKDVSIMQEGSEAFQRMVDIQEMFLEIHIILLALKEPHTEDISVARIAGNVWLYPTNSTSWWKIGYDAYKTAQTQLVFSGGFRADIVVSEDLFESGLAGWFLSKKYERPFQVHTTEDFFDSSYIESQDHPVLYSWATQYLLERVKSVRVKTEFQRQAVIAENSTLETTTELLPSYYNLNVWRDFVPVENLHEKYPQFNFIILHISSMRASSHSSEVLQGAAKILRRYPSIGLLMVGNGPLRSQLERQAIALGLQNQIEFLPMPKEVVSYMKSANILVQLSEDGAEDDLILEAAVSKLPLIANTRGIAGKLFAQGESACLCAPTDSECVADSINMYLNENQARARFALNASELVFERIEQDYGAYIREYSESIERCLAEVRQN